MDDKVLSQETDVADLERKPKAGTHSEGLASMLSFPLF